MSDVSVAGLPSSPLTIISFHFFFFFFTPPHPSRQYFFPRCYFPTCLCILIFLPYDLTRFFFDSPLFLRFSLPQELMKNCLMKMSVLMEILTLKRYVSFPTYVWCIRYSLISFHSSFCLLGGGGWVSRLTFYWVW